MREHFQKYGEVKRIQVKWQRAFGFVMFSDGAAVKRCLEDNGRHWIDGKLVECKCAENRRTTRTSGLFLASPFTTAGGSMTPGMGDWSIGVLLFDNCGFG